MLKVIELLASVGLGAVVAKYLLSNASEWSRKGLDALCDKFPVLGKALKKEAEPIEQGIDAVSQGLKEAVEDQKAKQDEPKAP